MNKKILGLDLGTTSIGWALVYESDNGNSSIEKVGVRIVPLTTDEENDFQKGKSTSINANRTSKRGARRTKMPAYRYKFDLEAGRIPIPFEGEVYGTIISLQGEEGQGFYYYAYRLTTPQEPEGAYVIEKQKSD